MRPRHLLAVALTLIAVRALLHFSGADVHACIVSGMPLSTASFVLGPLAVVVAFATPVVAPTLVLATGVLEARFIVEFWRRFTKGLVLRVLMRGPPDA